MGAERRWWGCGRCLFAGGAHFVSDARGRAFLVSCGPPRFFTSTANTAKQDQNLSPIAASAILWSAISVEHHSAHRGFAT